MMRHAKRLSTILCASALLSVSSTALAADHGDAPTSIASDAASDIADLYAWMDGDDVVLVATTPAAAFSDAVQYVFHVGSGTDFAAAGGTESTTILCTFDSSQMASCWVGDPGSATPAAYVTGDASPAAGIENTAGTLKVHAGSHDDPFFFNGSGFGATIDAVVAAAGGLTFDSDGCPALDSGTSTTLVTQLSTEDDGSTALDDFAGDNVSALVISVDKTLLNAGGDVLTVWASTNQ